VARGVEQVSTVAGVDVEEDPGDYDGMLFEQLFEEGLHNVKTREISQEAKEGGGKGRTRPLFKGCGRLSKFNQM
jgi:hypothetical protein